MKRIASLAAVTLGIASVLIGPAAAAHAAVPYWNKAEKCKQEDWQGRDIPTRVGNHELGWNHFSGKHNIKKCRVVNGPINGRPDVVRGARLEYWGYAINGSRQVKIVVIAQYARKTADGRYDAGRGKKIGVITAYCANVPRNKCPNWVNQ
ncbi:hypothetical protein AR457_40810 [Streptomyces agglomeratus]|uniref:hypothetical protein n=1 Tax=Streptomyces agglomeratus TaxID=285458 RepID=UPI0008543370|nr:hypothetical protein [Streptomyces agglomeratus]OEJ21779.1 hypothetical protein AR457_40810 [Streptomyces agglomeratus]